MPRSSNVARDKANPQPQRAVGEGGSYACRQCGSVLRRTRLPDHRAHADCPDCDLRHRRKFFCRHCKTFSKRDKFTRDHEFTHDDGCTRCAPGRVPDRTRKWSDEETDVICESQPASHRDLEQLLQRLNRGLKSGDAHTIDSLRRKVEYLGVSGKMARPRDATAPPQLAATGSVHRRALSAAPPRFTTFQVPSPPSPPQKREKRAKKDASPQSPPARRSARVPAKAPEPRDGDDDEPEAKRRKPLPPKISSRAKAGVKPLAGVKPVAADRAQTRTSPRAAARSEAAVDRRGGTAQPDDAPNAAATRPLASESRSDTPDSAPKRPRPATLEPPPTCGPKAGAASDAAHRLFALLEVAESARAT